MKHLVLVLLIFHLFTLSDGTTVPTATPRFPMPDDTGDIRESERPEDRMCFEKTGFVFPDGDDCRFYWSCDNGILTKRECREHTVFSEVVRACVDFNSLFDTCTRNNPIQGCAIGMNSVIPHPTKCNEFTSCVNGDALIGVCMVGQLFDIFRRVCSPSAQAECGFYRGTDPITVTEDSTTTTQKPLPANCTTNKTGLPTCGDFNGDSNVCFEEGVSRGGQGPWHRLPRVVTNNNVIVTGRPMREIDNPFVYLNTTHPNFPIGYRANFSLLLSNIPANVNALCVSFYYASVSDVERDVVPNMDVVITNPDWTSGLGTISMDTAGSWKRWTSMGCIGSGAGQISFVSEIKSRNTLVAFDDLEITHGTMDCRQNPNTRTVFPTDREATTSSTTFGLGNVPTTTEFSGGGGAPPNNDTLGPSEPSFF